MPSRTLLLLALLAAPALAEPITGVVTNGTNHKVAAGDDVVLLRLAQGMQELARTKTDSRGRFSIEVPADGLHLLRVTHEKANYFKAVQPGTQSVEIEVFSSAPTLEGVTLDADVMRIQTEPGGTGLKVVEHFFVKNDSSPAKTLFSEHPFELYLPPGATVEGSAAKPPSGMAVQSPLVPEGEPGKYTIIFPIRPGETEFQVSYKLPYKDAFTFKPRPVMPTDTIAIMMPKSMGFKPAQSTPYSAVTEELGAQTYVARNVQPSQPLDFTVSGIGELPRDAGATPGGGAAAGGGPAGPEGSAPGQTAPDTRPGGGLGVPVDPESTHDTLSKYKWWILAAMTLLFAAGAGLMLRRPAPAGPPGSMPVYPPGTGLLQALKDEVFAVETDRLEGRIDESEYTRLKAALDVVLRRALARQANPVKPATEA